MGSFVENVNKMASLTPANVEDLNLIVQNIDAINQVTPLADDLNDIIDNIIPNLAEILQADNNATIATDKATIATTKASEASASATTATTKAGEASTSASSALSYKDLALGYRNEAEGFAASINPSDIVHKTGNETINGIKTFTSFPISPSSAPTTDYQFANKKYVDDKVVIVPDATNSVKGIDYKGLLAEYEVTGSARTSIDFSGLDINIHKSYEVEIELINATASGASIYCFINGDTTQTNYYSQYIYSTSTTIGASRVNTAQIIQMVASQNSMSADCLVSLVNGHAIINNNNSVGVGTSLQTNQNITQKQNTVTNITQLTFTSSITSSIGVGSKIRIYRGDV